MARLISFLAAGVFAGFLASLFEVPNMIPILLVIFWGGMGAGLKLPYAVAGALLMPFAIVSTMWLLPGPNVYGRLYPADDSQLFEFFAVEEAKEIHAERLAAYEAQRESQQEAARASLLPVSNPDRPTLHEANLAALDRAAEEGGSHRFSVWPTRGAWVVGLALTILAWLANTFTTRPFRDPGPMGAA